MDVLSKLYDNWQIFILIYPGLCIMLRGLSEGLSLIGTALNRPEMAKIATGIGSMLDFIGKIIGYFGYGTPSAAKKVIAGK